MRAHVQFEPKVLGYLRFLQESKQVFDCIEGIVAESQDPSCAHLSYSAPCLYACTFSKALVCGLKGTVT